MSDHSGDTQIMPVSWENFRCGPSNGDFARLIPWNPTSRDSFRHVVMKMNANLKQFSHCRGMVHWEEGFSDDATSATDTDTDASFVTRHVPPAEPIKMTYGYYRLNMSIHPHSMESGWILGSGYGNDFGKTNDRIDFLLAPQYCNGQVRGRHCRIRRQLDHAGSMSIIVERHKVHVGPTLLQGQPKPKGNETKDFSKSQRVLGHNSPILIGSHLYLFCFTELSDIVNKMQLQEALRQVRSTDPVPSALMSPTPYQTAKEFHGYWMFDADRGGTSGTVSLAVHMVTAREVVIKRMKRNRQTCEAIDKEVKMLKMVSHHHIVKLVEYIGPTDGPSSYTGSKIHEVALVLQPAAAIAVPEFLDVWRSLIEDHDVFLNTIIYQACDGLAYLHQQGFMHRDIKPENLSMASLDPIHLVILDLGSMEHAKQSTNHFIGTVWYFAPEVWRVRENKSTVPFDARVDVFALAASILSFLVPQLDTRRTRSLIDISQKTKFDALQNYKPTELEDTWSLVKKMLSWDSKGRPWASSVRNDLKPKMEYASRKYAKKLKTSS